MLANARADRLGRFWRPYMTRRCLVPANGYFEWTADKQPWYFSHKVLPVICFAGLDTGRGFVIVTTDANADGAHVHERMPVVLEPDEARAWLDPEADDAARLAAPLAAGRLNAWRVAKAVGNVRNEGPELIEPVLD